MADMTIYDYLAMCEDNMDIDFTDTVFDWLTGIYGFGFYGKNEPELPKNDDWYAHASYKVFKEVEIKKFFNGAYAQAMADFDGYIRTYIAKWRRIFKETNWYGVEGTKEEIEEAYREAKLYEDDLVYDVLRLLDCMFSGNLGEGYCKLLSEKYL